LLGSIAKGLLGFGKKVTGGYGRMIIDAAKGEKGLSKLLIPLTAGGTLGATPIVGSAIRANVPGGNILAPSFIGRDVFMSRYV
jgi:hypothetical protein